MKPGTEPPDPRSTVECISLHSNRYLQEKDVSRAIACASAIGTDDYAMHSADPSYKFLKVHFSPPHEEQKFAVAYAEDAIFIAFRDTQDLKDVASDLKVKKLGDQTTGSAFH